MRKFLFCILALTSADVFAASRPVSDYSSCLEKLVDSRNGSAFGYNDYDYTAIPGLGWAHREPKKPIKIYTKTGSYTLNDQRVSCTTSTENLQTHFAKTLIEVKNKWSGAEKRSRDLVSTALASSECDQLPEVVAFLSETSTAVQNPDVAI